MTIAAPGAAVPGAIPFPPHRTALRWKAGARKRLAPFLFFLAAALVHPGSSVAAGLSNRATFPAAKSPFLSAVLRYSAQGSRDLLGLPVDPSKPERELARLADRLRPAVSAASGGQVPEVFRRVLLEEEGFSYDPSAGNPENYLLDSVLARKRGNCLGLSMLYLALASLLDVPFHGVYVPSHCFVRLEGGGPKVNVEFAENGAPWGEERYRRAFRLGPARPYLRSLEAPEMLGVFLKSLGAGYSRKGREEEALRLYEEAERLFPGLPDVYFNAGVSLQKLGRTDEAIARYRKALALDPEMAAPRDNLSVLLAKRGRYAEAIVEARRVVDLEPWNAASRGNLASAYCACGQYEEGIREFRKTLEIDPANRGARAGLTRAYFAQGAYREAARECEHAEALGCRFEPSIREVLGRYRDTGPAGGEPR